MPPPLSHYTHRPVPPDAESILIFFQAWRHRTPVTHALLARVRRGVHGGEAKGQASIASMRSRTADCVAVERARVLA